MFIEIKEKQFEMLQEANENANYPESGFYLVEVEGSTDLRFVDKSIKLNHLVCPKSVFDGVMTYMINTEQKDESDNIQLPPVKNLSGFVSEEFVIEFTKTLLGKK